jgi:arylsulfatase A-like enzyme
MGFWDYTAKGISTPSAAWMADLWKAQQAGGDLAAHESSQRAAELPNPAYSTTNFPGHSAWIDGDWKLHRIEGNNDKVKWELYNLADDPQEADDLTEADPDRVASMRGELGKWLVSVVNSLNGKDYAK